MQLAKVVGTGVATRKEQSLEGLKMLLVRQVDTEGHETGGFLVAADAVGAGPDDLINCAVEADFEVSAAQHLCQ